MLKVSRQIDVQVGVPAPLGISYHGNGINFALFSRNATRVRLELFDHPEDARAARSIDLDPAENHTGDVWHVWLNGIKPGQLYAYRVDGPYDPKAGQRFNFNKLLLDPYATAITRLPGWDFDPARGYDQSRIDGGSEPSQIDSAGAMPKCIITPDAFAWHNDVPPRHPWSRTVIYETHVRGLTIHPSSGVEAPGTYRGLVEKIPYFRKLGVTCLELMPILEFNESEVTSSLGKALKNYWGYDPVSFFAPKASYSRLGQGQQKQEFREMVRALHKADIEIILDVVFNHTAETDFLGPTLSLRGIDNTIFYILEDNRAVYKNFSGTGNTLSANHPVVQDMLLAALRYWVEEMHVDGFRFDLASALARDSNGALLSDAPVLKRIAEDPVLESVKLIAEPWDAAGAYQAGRFSGCRWAEWNDRYRDDVRRFWRGDDWALGAFASRICGSSDVFADSGKNPHHGINFITCHDGFTLNDLVSYRYKHNELNKQNNHDGAGENISDNYGIEGTTADNAVEYVRTCQIKNFLLTLFISRGVPMLLGGDEFRRTQQGNNNPYCQDNEISWYDWNCLKRNKQIFNFTRGLIAFRVAHPVLAAGHFYTDAEIQWFGPQGGLPNWSDPKEKRLGCLIREDDRHAIALLFNAATDAVDFQLPIRPPGAQWSLAADTSRRSPEDIYMPGQEQVVGVPLSFRLNPRSSAILLSSR